MTATTELLDLVRRWAAAEQDNDPGRLDEVLAGDFHGVGPAGFVLDRPQWLARFGNGLENRGPADRWLLANVHIGPLQAAGPRSA